MNAQEQKIEALLFYKNEPVSLGWLSRTLDMTETALKEALVRMESFYEGRGIQLVSGDAGVALMTHPLCHEVIEEIRHTDEEKELSKQALETLAIIVYRSGITKSEIDYIRGVNSLFILRNLQVRGLITKQDNPKDKRSPLYIPTLDLLAYLGLDQLEKLPDYEAFRKHILSMQEEYREEETEHL